MTPPALLAPTREDKFLAESVIRALKLGNVPQRGNDRLAVGRNRQVEQLRRDLDFAAEGGGAVKFFCGDYGSGKTFLCSLVREAAWGRNMAVAIVDLGRNASLARFESIYHQIMAGLRTRDLPHTPAFSYIVQQWLYQLEQAAAEDHGLDAGDEEQREQIAKHVERRINAHLADVSVFD
jgi:adenosylhomocysteinase